jgi:hypothetical protein
MAPGGTRLRRQRWMVIAAGLLLLAGDAPSFWGVEQFTGLAGMAAGSAIASEGSASNLESRLAAALEATNPRLGERRAARIASAVLRYSEQYDLPPDLVVAVILEESSARPEARSYKGAIGLMQVMPHMFEQLAMPGNLTHIETNIEAGCTLLADNIRRLGEKAGTSAYYWGSDIRNEGYVRRVYRRRRALAGLFELDLVEETADVGDDLEVGARADRGLG